MQNILIWAILLIWYLLFLNKIFHNHETKLNNFITAQSFWLFNQPPEQSKKITIVAIDDASLNELKIRWPWKRSIIAEIIRNISSFSPKVIGMDIIFSGKSEDEKEDKELVSAFQSHPNIVL